MSPSKDQKGLTPVSQSSQKKTHAMVGQSSENGEVALTYVNWREPDPKEIRRRMVQKDRSATTGCLL